MKRTEAQRSYHHVSSSIEIIDDGFLSAETNALSANKRRKAASIGTNPEEKEEGNYIAALRGSNSATWQQSPLNPFRANNKNVAYNNNRFDQGSSGGGGDVAESDGRVKKNCPCGSGVCSVFTANTEKNRGRMFYKCPLRQENGGCGFFEWCDKDSGVNNSENRYSYSYNYDNNAMNMAGVGNTSTSQELPCPCGAGSCLVLTAKTEKNFGQQFYKCPAKQESSCGFFRWCNDGNTTAPAPSVGASIHKNVNDLSNKSYSARTGSSCFKCGKEGHWANNCSSSSSVSPEITGKTTSSGSCYKCGKTGHWARDCTSSQFPTNI